MAKLLDDLRAHGEHQATLGRVAMAEGDRDRAQVHLDRAQVAAKGFLLARDEHELKSPQWCGQHATLLQRAHKAGRVATNADAVPPS